MMRAALIIAFTGIWATTGFSQNLIQNGNFSTPNAHWVTGGTGFHWGSNATNCYRSAPAFAWFADTAGSYQHHNNVTGWIYQEFVVPHNIVSAQLQFYVSINTYDSDAFPYDSLLVQLWNQSNLPLVTLMLLSNEQGTQSLICQPYVLKQESNKTTTALATRGGQTLRLAFKAINDISNGTIFRIDDVSLSYSLSCPPPGQLPSPQGPTEVCEGAAYFYSVTSFPGQHTYSWIITNGMLLGQNQNTVEVLWNNAGIGKVQAFATNACGDGPLSSPLEVMIEVPPVVDIQASAPYLCSGQGSVTLMASGASRYVWSTGALSSQITVSSGGGYSVTGGIAGCEASASYHVAEVTPPIVTITATPDTPVTPLTPVQLSVLPANAATYEWNLSGLQGATPTIFPEITATYRLTLTDQNGCTASSSITIEVRQPPACDSSSLSLSSSVRTFPAYGGIDTLFVGFSPASAGCRWGVDLYDCSWVIIHHPVSAQQQSGMIVYEVLPNHAAMRACTLRVHTGIHTYTIALLQDSVSTLCDALIPPRLFYQGDCLVEATYIPHVSYQWYVNNQPLQADTQIMHQATQTGDYYVVIRDTNQCIAFSDTIFLDCQLVTIEQPPVDIHLSLYPNPNSGRFAIIVRPRPPQLNIAVYNVAGHQIAHQIILNEPPLPIEIEITHPAQGMYFLILFFESDKRIMPVIVR